MRTAALFCVILLTGLAAGFEGDLTFYSPDVGTSACGRSHSNLEYVAALSPDDFINTPNPNNSPSCQQCVLITGPSGAKVKVQVTDKCPGCVKGALDVSPAAFDEIADRDVGRIRVSWEYVACDGGVRQVSPASLVGYYAWTWQSTPGLSDATMSVAFSGWTDVQNALSDSGNVYDSLKGTKYISFGGGNANGRFSLAGIAGIDAAISGGLLSGYSGIVYDVEEGDSGLAAAFANSFSLAKSFGFSVVVTVSHSAPYGIADAHTLMGTFLSSPNIDYISPQLYTSGTEASNDYDISSGYGWDNYRNSNPAVVVSIVRASYYDDAVGYFNNIGVPLSGYIQWEQ